LTFLFDNRFWPTTNDVVVVDAPFEDAAASCRRRGSCSSAPGTRGSLTSATTARRRTSTFSRDAAARRRIAEAFCLQVQQEPRVVEMLDEAQSRR
jgi:hypothetical protein